MRGCSCVADGTWRQPRDYPAARASACTFEHADHASWLDAESGVGRCDCRAVGLSDVAEEGTAATVAGHHFSD